MTDELKACPNCNNVGWYPIATENNRTGEVTWEQVQCEFCYTEPNSVFNVISALRAQLADTQARLVVSEKRLKLIQQISDGRRALMVCYRLGTHKGADAALTRIEKAEVALAMLGGET